MSRSLSALPELAQQLAGTLRGQAGGCNTAAADIDAAADQFSRAAANLRDSIESAGAAFAAISADLLRVMENTLFGIGDALEVRPTEAPPLPPAAEPEEEPEESPDEWGPSGPDFINPEPDGPDDIGDLAADIQNGRATGLLGVEAVADGNRPEAEVSTEKPRQRRRGKRH